MPGSRESCSFALWRALASFRGECSERTLIYRIAHNRGLTHRARRRIRATEPLHSADVVPIPGPIRSRRCFRT